MRTAARMKRGSEPNARIVLTGAAFAVTAETTDPHDRAHAVKVFGLLVPAATRRGGRSVPRNDIDARPRRYPPALLVLVREEWSGRVRVIGEDSVPDGFHARLSRLRREGLIGEVRMEGTAGEEAAIRLRDVVGDRVRLRDRLHQRTKVRATAEERRLDAAARAWVNGERSRMT